MALVQVADFGFGRERFDRAPAGDAKDNFLQQPDLAAVVIELAGDTPVGGGLSGSFASSK
jgi:hypothetical protein